MPSVPPVVALWTIWLEFPVRLSPFMKMYTPLGSVVVPFGTFGAKQEKTVLGQCITSINNFFTVVGENGTSAEQSTAQTTMETNCNAAQKYLN